MALLEKDLAEYKQLAELLATQLETAKSQEGYWLNPTAKAAPRIYGMLDKDFNEHNAFNLLTLALRSDQLGADTNVFVKQQWVDSKKQEQKPQWYWSKPQQKSSAYIYYDWSVKVNRYNPTEEISKRQWDRLPASEQNKYKGKQIRKYYRMFNIDQTKMDKLAKEEYNKLIVRFGKRPLKTTMGGAASKAFAKSLNAIRRAPGFAKVMKNKTTTGGYNYNSDVIQLKKSASKIEEAQDAYRYIAEGVGSSERKAREGAALNSVTKEQSSQADLEALIIESISALKMLELGLPARISEENMGKIDTWVKNLKTNPKWIEGLEADVNQGMHAIYQLEQGKGLGVASAINKAKTNTARDMRADYINNNDAKILKNILAYGGRYIDPALFDSTVDQHLFLEKHNLTDNFREIDRLTEIISDKRNDIDRLKREMDSASDKQTKEIQNEIEEISEEISAAYTMIDDEAVNVSEQIRDKLGLAEGENETYEISDYLATIPKAGLRSDARFIIVTDKQTGDVDIVLPNHASFGGWVELPANNSTRKETVKLRFSKDPDEAMLADERKAELARVRNENPRGLAKGDILKAINPKGDIKVQLFETQGDIKYRPSDRYFIDKEVEIGTIDRKNNITREKIDVSARAEEAQHYPYEKFTSIEAYNSKKYAFVIKPKDGPQITVYPDKADVNRFFTTAKAANTLRFEVFKQRKESSDAKLLEALTQRLRTAEAELGSVKQEMVDKYIALWQLDNSRNVDIFEQAPEDLDLSMIKKVEIPGIIPGSEELYIKAEIEGLDTPLDDIITRKQWSRVMNRGDQDEIEKGKIILAANVFETQLREIQQQKSEFTNTPPSDSVDNEMGTKTKR